MKKLVLIAVASLACVAAFAQGRVSFVNDSLHLVYYNVDPISGGPFAGQGVDSAHMPAIPLVADLYLGTSSSSLNLMTTTTFGASVGKWNTVNLTVPGIAGGTQVFVVVQVRDQSAAPPSTWTPLSTRFGEFYGASPEFQFTLGTSTLAYPPLYAPGASLGGGFSTWPLGLYPMDNVSPGFRGSIIVTGLAVPEPTSFALAGLGAAALLIFRRRK
jgi:PEP-CTERM motif